MVDAHVPDPHVQDVVATHERGLVEWDVHVHDDPPVRGRRVASISVVGPDSAIGHAHSWAHPEGQFEDQLVTGTGSGWEPPQVV